MPNPTTPTADAGDELQAEVDMLFASFNMLGNTQLIDGVKQLVVAREQEAERRALNSSRNVLHGILSKDIDSLLDHSDIETAFVTHLKKEDK